MSAGGLHREVRGEGPALVFVHGHPFDHRMWQPQLEALADRFTVVVFDLPGYGRSAPAAAPGSAVSMRELAEATLSLLTDLGLDRPVLAGLSMGGLVAMEVCIAAPERVAGVALCATTAQPVTGAEVRQRGARADQLEADGMLPLALDMGAQLFGPRAARDADLVSFVMDMMLHAPPAGAAAALRGRAQRPDYRPLLGALPMPALVVAGDADPYAPEEVVAELVGSLPDPKVLRLPGVGHLPNLEAPEAFNAALREFALDALEPAS